MFLTKFLRAADHPYLMGKGGRNMNNGPAAMQGMNVKSLKHHIALWPLFIIMGAGSCMVTAYCIRYLVFDIKSIRLYMIEVGIEIHRRKLV